MRAKQYKFTLDDIADAASRNPSTVRSDIGRGKLDPDDLMSVARYLHGHANGFHQPR